MYDKFFGLKESPFALCRHSGLSACIRLSRQAHDDQPTRLAEAYLMDSADGQYGFIIWKRCAQSDCALMSCR